MKSLVLAAAIGLLAATVTADSGRAVTPPKASAENASLIVQVSLRCNRLLRRCNRGNEQACKLHRVECVGVRPIY